MNFKNEEDFKDRTELERQRKEHIIQNNQYVKYEIIVSAEEDEADYPITSIEIHNASSKEIMKLFLIMEESLKRLKEEYPLEAKMSKIFYGASYLGNDKYEKGNDEDE